MTANHQRDVLDAVDALAKKVRELQGQLSAAIGSYSAFPCTSTTRPASPRAGMLIEETDTGNIQIWNGSAWVFIAHTGGWNPYTCTWAGTGVSLGTDGTLSARWTKTGRTVTVAINLTIGSTTTVGTGTWTFTLPVAVASTLTDQGYAGAVFVNSAGAFNRVGAFIVAPGATDGFICSDNVGVPWNGTTPQTWGVGDGFTLNVTYETAS